GGMRTGLTQQGLPQQGSPQQGSPQQGSTQQGSGALKTQPVLGLQLSEVQTLPSSQVIGAKEQPVVGLQLSAVQALLSLQEIGSLWQFRLASQLSTVQALLSLHWAEVVQPWVQLARQPFCPGGSQFSTPASTKLSPQVAFLQ